MNASNYFIINPLENLAHNAVCVIKLLLVIALRFGRVKHTTIDEVLAAAAARPDGLVEWSTPNAPVLCFAPGLNKVANIEKPIEARHINDNLQAMAQTVGLLTEVTSHDIRRGALRDVAHLPNQLLGVATNAVQVLAGHSESTRRAGVTQQYVGFIQEPTWNMRAESDFQDRAAPYVTANPFKSSRKTPAALNAYMDQNNLDKASRSERLKAGRQMDRDTIQVWRDTEEPKSVRVSTLATPQTLVPRTQSQLNASTGSTLAMTAASESSCHQAATAVHHDPVDSNPVPPANNPINEAENLAQLEDLLFGQDGPPTANADPDDDQDAVEEALFGEDIPLPLERLEGNAFVSKFAAINIYLAGQSHRAAALEQHPLTTNSRDEPTLFMHTCSKCPNTTHSRTMLERHERSCQAEEGTDSQAANDANRFPCTVDGYESFFSSLRSLKQHLDNLHGGPRVCMDCEGKPVFASENQFRVHCQKEHPGDTFKEPEQCPLIDECQVKKQYTR
jgi:hypothetical protein